MNYKTIRYAIEKECQRISLTDWCENWGFTTDDFDKYLDSADNALRAQQGQQNEPLTLAELGEMSIADWVWAVFPEYPPIDHCWYRAKKLYDMYSHDNYGKVWLAYRHKLE